MDTMVVIDVVNDIDATTDGVYVMVVIDAIDVIGVLNGIDVRHRGCHECVPSGTKVGDVTGATDVMGVIDGMDVTGVMDVMGAIGDMACMVPPNPQTTRPTTTPITSN